MDDISIGMRVEKILFKTTVCFCENSEKSMSTKNRRVINDMVNRSYYIFTKEETEYLLKLVNDISKNPIEFIIYINYKGEIIYDYRLSRLNINEMNFIYNFATICKSYKLGDYIGQRYTLNNDVITLSEKDNSFDNGLHIKRLMAYNLLNYDDRCILSYSIQKIYDKMINEPVSNDFIENQNRKHNIELCKAILSEDESCMYHT